MTNRLTSSAWRRGLAGLMILLAAGLAACNSSGDGAAGSGSEKQCDSSTQDCGTVNVAVTDADGDFTAYNVSLVSFQLERQDGTQVEVLPKTTDVDLTQYADLTEFLSSTSIPVGTYVKAVVTVDYSDAGVYVEQNGQAVKADVVDGDGNPAGQMDLNIQLADGQPLRIRKGEAAFLNVDFNLEASNTVDLGTTPPTVTVQPFIVASFTPDDDHEFRVRGPLASVDTSAGSYQIGLRPFFRHDGDFGKATVHVDSQTTYEIDGRAYTGSDGLATLSSLDNGTATVALGEYDVASHRFSATEVYAGSSVPGGTLDGVRGSVTARSGNQLTVQGATLIRDDGSVIFNDHVTVNIGAGTHVLKAGMPGANPDLSAISVGQHIVALGTVTDSSSDNLTLDATNDGFVRLLPTHLSGTVQMIQTGEVTLDLQSIGARRASVFDFSGTGATSTSDADPANYQVGLGSLSGSDLAASDPVRITGFVHTFGNAPPDFDARSIANFREGRAAILAGWGSDGTTAPFSVMNSDSLTVDLANGDLGAAHYLRRGTVLTDLNDLPASPPIGPNSTGIGLFAIGQEGSVQLFFNFSDFESALAGKLDGSTHVRGFFAYGGYDSTTNAFTANTIAVQLK